MKVEFRGQEIQPPVTVGFPVKQHNKRSSEEYFIFTTSFFLLEHFAFLTSGRQLSWRGHDSGLWQRSLGLDKGGCGADLVSGPLHCRKRGLCRPSSSTRSSGPREYPPWCMGPPPHEGQARRLQMMGVDLGSVTNKGWQKIVLKATSGLLKCTFRIFVGFMSF